MLTESTIDRLLQSVERAGNRLPHPTLLFIGFSIVVVLLSWLLAQFNVAAVHPISGERLAVINLLSHEGLQRILTNAVTNFTQFAPVGVVLVVMMGIGIAEHSGLIGDLLKRIVSITRQNLLAYILAFAGVMSSIGADVGYVVLIPIAAMIYRSFDRPPLAGIAVTFAGVSAGFSANLLLGPVDVMLAGISTEAAQLVESQASVSASDNYYFIVASTFLICIVCGWLSNHVIEPRLSHDASAVLTTSKPAEPEEPELNPDQPINFWPVSLFTVLFIALLAFLSLPEGAALHNQLLKSIIPLLALYFGLAGYIHGKCNRVYQSASDAVASMEKALQTMAYYLVLMFFAAQFVNYFAWSHIGVVSAINGASWLSSLNMPASILLLSIIILSATINLFVGSASAKWALLAPVFIPMLMLVDIPPAQTQIAYRVGDSVTNIITPLMPYFGIVLAYAQRYQPTLGLGNIVAVMLPYSACLLLLWGCFVAAWISIGLPLGPN